MGLLRSVAAALEAGLTRPQDSTPVDMTGGRGPNMARWTTAGTKGTALSVTEWSSTIFAIVDAQATAQTAIEWQLWRTAASGRKEDRTPAPTHPAAELWENPNEFYTQADLIEVLTNHFELTGEMWILPAFSTLGVGPPLELWAVRPDQMRPVPHPTEFIQGYVYDGGPAPQPLNVGQVIWGKKQHPKDPYRGLSPITAALTDLRAEREAAEYNASFFANDATPGGLVKIPGYLPEERWKELVARWNEQHRGRGNAHRIHVMDNVEGSEYVNLGYTRKDMQFTELRRFNVEAFMRAYRISNFVLGMLADVNRATAEAADVWFGKAHVIPRANRLRRLLNQRLLPMYGPAGRGFEFDYADPIPPDRAQAQAEQTADISNALALIGEGFDEGEVLEFFGLPQWKRTAPAPAPQLVPAAAGDAADEDPVAARAERLAAWNGAAPRARRRVEVRR
jgi:HK97 family phage portal protein